MSEGRPKKQKPKGSSPKSEVGSQKSERVKADTSPIDTPHSAIKKSEIENPTSDIKMEVHHHPQLEHKPKPWKEYLLEGLMIFVAVLMGFIAENIRESITEHKRASEFAQSYYADIRKDTSLINKAIGLSKHKMAAMDSMVAVLYQPPSPLGDTILTFKSIAATSVLPFEPSSGTLEGIKTSGAVRSFRQKMIRLMNEYDLQARAVIRRDEIMQKFITEQYIPGGLDNFNFETSYDALATGRINHKLYVNRSREFTGKFINLIVIDKLMTLRSMQEYKKLLTVADKVLAELKNEYSVEDE